MPTLSTLRTLTLALAIAIDRAQATVVIPYVSYVGPGPWGVPNEFVRDPLEGPDNYQSRFGVHLTIGTPPQHVWVAPQFYDSETHVRSISLCDDYVVEGPQGVDCESLYSGVFSANESSTFEQVNGTSFGMDVTSAFEAVPDLESKEFKFEVQTTNMTNFIGQDWGTLGLGSNSTFLQTFFPGKEQIGIYYTGGNSTHGKPEHSMPPRPLVVYELEFDGYNQSHYTGPKFTQPIGPPSAASNSTNPFTLNVTSVKVGRTEISGGESFIATVDLSGRTSNILPPKVFDAFVSATGARVVNGLPAWEFMDVPPYDQPDGLYNLTLTFSNGYSVSLPQTFFVNYNEAIAPGNMVASILNADDPAVIRSWPVRGPVIALNQLMFSSYIGIDHATEEWWLAKAVHPWDQSAKDEPKESVAAGGIGDNLRKTSLVAAALAVAAALFC
ncbi:hypothetical protein TWF718_003077 [Orbilia javanica]|uniref:Peptidase A1 domain-containing protein n=1 Tax=Orbilia javanica TaxID=47235 RepID=A0AAN8MMJ9_9PEZI